MKEKSKLKLLDKNPTKVGHENDVNNLNNVKQNINNQTNPIYKKLAKFNNAKISDKLGINDLLK